MTSIIPVRETKQQEVAEGTTATLTWTLKDDKGVVVPLASLQTLVWTHYDERSRAIVNGRNAVNVKNANGGTVNATTGECSLVLTELDNVLVDATSRSEWKVAFFKGTFNGGAGIVEKEVAYRVRNTGP